MRFALLAMFLLATPAAADDQHKLSAAAVVQKVTAHYAKVKQFSCRFIQLTTNLTFDVTKTASGELFVQRPAKLRLDFQVAIKGRTTKSIVLDGKQWVVDHEHKEVIVTQPIASPLTHALAFLYGAGDLARTHRASVDTEGTIGKSGKNAIVVALKPKTKVGYETLYLVVDPASFAVTRSIVVSATEEYELELFDTDTTTEIDARKFVFDFSSDLKDYRVLKPKR